MRRSAFNALAIVLIAYLSLGSQVFRSSKFVTNSNLPVSYTFSIAGSGTQPIPAGATSVRVRVYGSGGGGGVSGVTTGGGGGGGGGGFSDKTYTIAAGDVSKSIPWVVGNGGAGRTVGSGSGLVGAATTCGSAVFTLNAVSLNQSGGSGGGGTTTNGGAGGIGTGGSTNHTGTAGGNADASEGGAAADSGPGEGGFGELNPADGANGQAGQVVMDFS